MTTEQPSVHADLAFLRALADSGGAPEINFGRGYLAAGLLFGAQVLFQWADFAEVLPLPGLAWLVVITAPTALLIAYLFWINRGVKVEVGSNRALNAVFMSAGLANLAILTIVAIVAFSLDAHYLWMVYGAVVFAFQGAAWFVAYRLVRRTWMLVVALGWFANSVAGGVAIGAMNTHAFIAVAVFALFVLMALPGAIIVRGASQSAA